MNRYLRTVTCLLLGAAIWLPTLQLWFRTTPEAIERPLAAAQLAAWERADVATSERLTALRRSNPEWDLMARTFTVLAFANLALESQRERYVAAIDRIIDDTLRLEATYGHRYFLLAYADRAPFRDPAGRSLFVDGELALMLGARQLIAPDAGRAAQLRERVARIAGQLERGPILVGESYPDEVWVFCNAVAVAALRVADVTSGSNHASLIARWIASARDHLVDPQTGLLVAKTTYDGRHLDGPEGSTIWLVADMLLVVDPDFARDQYRRARAELGGGWLGFAWAREWPASWVGPEDIDSGPTIPLVGANAGSSGLALVGAAAFGDRDFVDGLLASLEIGAFPIESDGGLRFAAGNQLADAVILYALASGPLWKRVAS